MANYGKFTVNEWFSFLSFSVLVIVEVSLYFSASFLVKTTLKKRLLIKKN